MFERFTAFTAMSILTAIVAMHQTTPALTALVANRAYPLTAPQGAPAPYYVFQRISTPQRAGSHAGDSRLEQVRCQFTTVAATALVADTLASAIKAAYLGFAGELDDVFVSGITLGGDIDDFNPETGRYMRMIDLIFWQRPAGA